MLLARAFLGGCAVPLLNLLLGQVLLQDVFLSEHLRGSAEKLETFFRGRSGIWIGRPREQEGQVIVILTLTRSSDRLNN